MNPNDKGWQRVFLTTAVKEKENKENELIQINNEQCGFNTKKVCMRGGGGRLCGGGGCGEGGKPGVGESVLKGDEYNDGNCQFVLSKDLNGKIVVWHTIHSCTACIHVLISYRLRTIQLLNDTEKKTLEYRIGVGRWCAGAVWCRLHLGHSTSFDFRHRVTLKRVSQRTRH